MTNEQSASKCAVCGKPQEQHYRPFCSKRCADVDLHRWFTGAYAVPAVEADDDGETGREGDSGG